MTPQEAHRFWFGRVDYERRTPLPGDLKLDRMRLLLSLLGNPQERLRFVHVAGSKGKGSMSAMLAAVLQASGYRTGLFTSPHLSRVEERFQVDGMAIEPAELTALLGDIATACRLPGARLSPLGPLADTLTFFEIATAVGFLHFARRRAEVTVLEVGLGGRFDSTNVCLPLVSVLTSISFDHMQQLGNTLERIALEKAGIVKSGRPTLSGVTVPEARRAIEDTCRRRGAPLLQLGTDFTFEYDPALIGKGEDRPGKLRVRTASRSWPAFEMGLVGAHQAANAALVVLAVEILRRQGLTIPDAALARGLVEVHWPARLEVLGRKPLVLLDCAHNVASAQALVRTLEESFPLDPAAGPPRRLLLFAASRDKDLAGMLEVLAGPFDRIFLTRFQSNPRCADPGELVELLPERFRKSATVCQDPEEAWNLARAAASPHDLVCITGSVFLAGEMRSLLLDRIPHGLAAGM